MTSHGDERNRRQETERTTQTFHTIQGPPTEVVAGMSHTRTVTERWCEVCDDWVTTYGIMGALLCPQCNATWDKSLWHSPTEPQPEGGWWAEYAD